MQVEHEVNSRIVQNAPFSLKAFWKAPVRKNPDSGSTREAWWTPASASHYIKFTTATVAIKIVLESSQVDLDFRWIYLMHFFLRDLNLSLPDMIACVILKSIRLFIFIITAAAAKRALIIIRLVIFSAFIRLHVNLIGVEIRKRHPPYMKISMRKDK